ncbi:hypothetical protein [Oceanobacillus picturae]|jgi:hypothetical protein
MQLGNVLVFGGTGMLAEATGWIAKHANHTIPLEGILINWHD